MKKGTNTDRIKRAFDICRKYKLRTLANLMINTPTETEDDLNSTISFAKGLRPTIYSYAVTVPLIGTEVYEKYVAPKLTRAEYPIYLDDRIYRGITDKRFKLASHNKDINLISRYLYYRFMFLRYYLDALIYFLRKYRFYKKSNKWQEYRSAIIRKYTASNRITRLINRLRKALLESKVSILE
jgi:radical SAM superfamily enzyme YgiQ (UPF0313 family)